MTDHVTSTVNFLRQNVTTLYRHKLYYLSNKSYMKRLHNELYCRIVVRILAVRTIE